MKPRRTLALGSMAALLLALSLLAGADTLVQLQARLSQESDPVKRAGLQIRLAEVRLQEARQLYEEAAPDKGLAKLREMLSLVTEAHDQLFATGRDPRKKPKGFKEAEIKLRELARHLDDLKLSVPVAEREEVTKISQRISEMREHLLHGIMRVRPDKK